MRKTLACLLLLTAAAVLAFSRRRSDEPVVDQSTEDALRGYDLELVPVPAGEVRD